MVIDYVSCASAEKKERLDSYRPLQLRFKNLNAWFDIELTYTSNAIEGNTLTRAETSLVNLTTLQQATGYPIRIVSAVDLRKACCRYCLDFT